MLRPRKDLPHILQRPPIRLGKQEVHDWTHHSTRNGIDNIVLIPDIVERNRGDFRNNEIEQPVCRSANSGHVHAEFLRGDFRRIEEVCAEKPEREEEHEEEEKEGRRVAGIM